MDDNPRWIVMHLVVGFLLAVIFQPAHVLEHHAFYNASEDSALELDNTRLEHQLLSSRILAQITSLHIYAVV